VRGIDGASWNNKRLDGVSRVFQVSTHLVECHIDDSSNIFANDPSWAYFPYDSKHLWPEITVVCFASSLPGTRKGLAGEPPSDNVNCSIIFSLDFSYVVNYRYIRPMLV
jgi:hypothetical protein